MLSLYCADIRVSRDSMNFQFQISTLFQPWSNTLAFAWYKVGILGQRFTNAAYVGPTFGCLLGNCVCSFERQIQTSCTLSLTDFGLDAVSPIGLILSLSARAT